MAGLAVIAAIIMAGTVFGVSYGAPDHMEITIYSDGLAHVVAWFEVDPQEPSFVVDLPGSAVDNFVAVDDIGVLLAAEQEGANSMALETLGSGGNIKVIYDIHDIVSKSGRIWTFSLDVDHDYTVLMPGGAVIVGMNVIPYSLDTVGESIRLEMPDGEAQIRYITNTGNSENMTAPMFGFDLLILIPVVAAVAGGTFLTFRIRSRRSGSEAPPERLDPQTIFTRIPDLRDDDKEIIRYICENGGEVSESSLRKKFLRPKTTMWRAVQRLSREGVVDIIKRDSLNYIRIKGMEDVP